MIVFNVIARSEHTFVFKFHEDKLDDVFCRLDQFGLDPRIPLTPQEAALATSRLRDAIASIQAEELARTQETSRTEANHGSDSG